MENEDKKIEEGQEGEKPEVNAETKASPTGAEKKKACKEKMFAIWAKNKKVILAVIVLIVIVGAGLVYVKYFKRTDIGIEGVKAKVTQFIKDNAPQGGAGVTIEEVVKDKNSGLYKVTLNANKQEVITYITADGKKFFLQTVDLDDAAKKAAGASDQTQAPEKTEAEAKTDVPTVDLFVMSYCPYGLQMEKGVLPAVEALGSKIKFNLKFVSYTLHGQKEIDENLNQYCIEKTQSAKLGSYLKCFWKDSKGTAAGCMKAVGINVAQITTCVADAMKQFNPTEKAFDINKDENVKFGVQGSPTLVVNGTTVTSGRDSASVLKAICSGFTTQPKECQAKLSAVAPGAGFDDQAAASAGGSAPAASCATPQN